jgi:hypothetical protein
MVRAAAPSPRKAHRPSHPNTSYGVTSQRHHVRFHQAVSEPIYKAKDAEEAYAYASRRRLGIRPRPPPPALLRHFGEQDTASER